MNLLRFRTADDGLPFVCTSADIARLTGLSRGRITQLRSADPAVALPAPDAEDRTAERPLWYGKTVARWCAATGRRLPARTASWLLPGPDGPRLQRTAHRTVPLRQDPGADADERRPPIDVHLASYTTPSPSGPSVWLATVMAPGESSRLWGWPPRWPHGSPLHHLVHEALDGLEVRRFARGALLGTLVVLPTEEDSHFSRPGLVRLLDLYRSDAQPDACDNDRLHRRLRQFPVQAEEMKDLAAALGHRLPWWPAGCATPTLAVAWDPDVQLTEPIPPPLAEADAFRRRCAATADQLDGELATSVRALGDAHWNQASRPWRPGYAGGRATLPADCDPDVWQLAVHSGLPAELPGQHGDFFPALDWLMEHAPSRRLARDAHRIFGDPDSARTVLLNTAELPEPVAALLTETVTEAEPSSSYRAERVLDELEVHPDGAAHARLGTWPASAGPAWCATAAGTALLAVHVPRRVPTPGPAEAGAFLGAVALRTVTYGDSYGLAPAVVLVTTDQDRLVILPECGEPDRLAAVIEHTVWHPGTQVHLVGLEPSMNQQLITTIESLITASPRTIPWEQLERLVGPHPDRDYCMYCRLESAA
ncbi:hypothetical protein DT019_27110 [Streptomyces sp. SDr-06]|uniref:hypothetical protein n=1 Tax=Streptomyces sp. SDr-06 TaxID=2267702 RepID=UPI000DE97C8C|nr:hypothetical protein [Streptomyces sp. SDr-06]RCH65472.1 hypothetical protein DT019_27110 [Streptomyces sp. SDr-06]